MRNDLKLIGFTHTAVLPDLDNLAKELSETLGQKSISGQLKKVLSKLLKDGLVEWTEQEIAKSSKQQYRITQKGTIFLQLIKNE